MNLMNPIDKFVSSADGTIDCHIATYRGELLDVYSRGEYVKVGNKACSGSVEYIIEQKDYGKICRVFEEAHRIALTCPLYERHVNGETLRQCREEFQAAMCLINL
jgi:hypothetical protein